MSTVTETLLTAEEFARLPDMGVPMELVRGRIVHLEVSAPRHGQICSRIARLVGNQVKEKHLGHMVTNDSAVVTARGPDTVRGGDVCFYSYSRVSPGPLPQGYLSVVPELIFEVRSPTDRWAGVLAKVSEYLDAGVSFVCVLDQMSETLHIYQQEELPLTLHGDDDFQLPALLGEFRVRVQRFFE